MSELRRRSIFAAVPAPLAAVGLVALAVLTGCASPPEPRAPEPPAPTPTEPRHTVSTFLRYASPRVTDVALTVYPRPQHALYGSELLPLDGAELVGYRAQVLGPSRRMTMALNEWALSGPEVPRGGFVLRARAGPEGTELVEAALSDEGDQMLKRALRQLTVTIDGKRYIRACSVSGEPAFALRGSKRPRAWEQAYGANFVWGRGGDTVGRESVAWVAPPHPLDASEAGIDLLVESLERAHSDGVRRFAVKFDDVGFAMTPETRLAYGNYPRALRALLRAVRERMEALSPAAVFYYLPQTYWWNDERLGGFARDLNLAGGLDPRWGLVMTGPQIISETIGPDGLVLARASFGLTNTRSLIYDNLGREGDWGPLTGRNPSLVKFVDGVFGERGTAVNRLTRLDWHWNPLGYDAEWSYRRAVLELAGLEHFAALLSVCDAFRSGLPASVVDGRIELFATATSRSGLPGPVARDELLAELRADVQALRSADGADD